MASRVATALDAYEQSIAQARGSALALGMALLEAQKDRRLAPVVGRQALAAVTASQGGLDDALRHADAAHRAVATVAKFLGFDPSAYGAQKGPGDVFFRMEVAGDQATTS